MNFWVKRLKPILFILTLIFIVLITDWVYFHGRIYPGVYFNNIHLGGKSWQEAAAILKEYEVTLSLPEGRLVPVRLTQVGITINEFTMTTNAYLKGRTQPWPLSCTDRLKLILKKSRLAAIYELDEMDMQSSLALLSSSLAKLPKEAKINAANGSITIMPEEAGYTVEVNTVRHAILDYLKSPRESAKIHIPVQFEQPLVTVSFLHENNIRALRGEFTTTFDATQVERSHNIRLAAKTIDNQMIEDGDVFSLNDFLGDTTPEKGYKKAPIIVGDNLVPGYGGGLCQVSTTLYNAALLAGLTITERHPHGMAVPYVPPGRDATIAYPGKDLKVKNTTGQPILITAKTTETDLTFSIFGAPFNDEVIIETKTLKVYMPPTRYRFDPNLPPGEQKLVEGEPGYLVEARRIFRRKNGETYSEELSRDSYTPYPIVIYQGPGRS